MGRSTARDPQADQTNELGRMPSTSTTLSVRESPVSRAGLGRAQALRCAARRRRFVHEQEFSAGVAQLVERQPSKLNVASSSLVSRSVLFLGRGLPNPRPFPAKGSFRAGGRGLPNPRSVGLGRGLSNLRLVPAKGLFRAGGPVVGDRSSFAHLAQLVEHVLGKDEVTSSILVVGSKRLRHAVPLAFVTTEPATH